MSDHSRPATTIALGLTVDDGAERHDIIAELPPGAGVDALARALSGTLPHLPPVVDLRVKRTGESLPPDAVAMDRDLRSGDTLEVSASVRVRAPQPTSADLDLDIVLRPSVDDVEIVLQGAEQHKLDRDLGTNGSSYSLVDRNEEIMLALPEGVSVLSARADGTLATRASSDSEPLCEIDVSPDGVAVSPAEAGKLVSISGTVCAPGAWSTWEPGSKLRVGHVTAVLRHEPNTVTKTGSREERLVIGDGTEHRRRLDLDVGGEIGLHRPPRRRSAWRPVIVDLPETPRPRTKLRLPLAAALVPLVAGLVLFAVTGSKMMLAFMLLSPMMAGATYWTDRRSRKEDREQSGARFEARLDEAYRQLHEAHSAEATERRAAAPPVDVLLDRIDRFDAQLWERRPWDPDFLTVRVGVGDLPALGQAKLRTATDVDPDPRLSELADAVRTLASVPATVPLKSDPVLGLAGDRVASTALARSLILQIAALHSPLELGIAAALPPGAEEGWEWLKWLPHTHTAAGILEMAPLGTGRRGIELLRAVRDAADRRRARRTGHGGDQESDGTPTLLLLVDEHLQVDRALAAEILTQAEAANIAVLWVGNDPRSLPGECGHTVDCDSAGSATLAIVGEGIEHRGLRIEGVASPRATRAARTLAPARDVTLASGAAQVPDRIKLLDQLQLSVPTAEQVAERWQQRARGIGAEIGMAAGVPLHVDLRTDGPHALIAGTTGAGKSELLRSIVAALAATHPPDRLTFLLIDYKGGAAFAPCAGLPHVLDVVSDLDAELGERALVSLRAEMTYREQLLADTRADNLIDLERRSPELAPPNLLIVVDEFAKLREEIPEFVDGVVDVAQRGRTLGIHMVLAAQSLRNAFTPAVRANTNLRIALRVTDDTESQDVIDAVDAARIPSGDSRKGRAYARIGHERLTEFQTAHVSGRYLPPSRQEVVVRPFRFDDVPTVSARRQARDEAPPGSEETDLAELRRAIVGATHLLGLPAPRPAWTQPLPPELPRPTIQHATNADAGIVALGLKDLPGEQRQEPFTVELDRGHVAIYGTGGTGKTTALQTLATALAAELSPTELELHVIDADGGAIGLLDHLPQVSAVLAGSDAERIERLLGYLEGEVRRRSSTFSSVGAATLTEYLARADAAHFSRLVVLIDGFGEFANLYDTARPDSLFDRLAGLLGAARSVGVHIVISADRRGAVRSVIAASFPQRILLRQTVSDDLVAFGVATKTADRIELSAGRAFVDGERIVQLAIPIPATAAADPADGFRTLGRHLREVWPTQQARQIGSLPELVLRSELATATATFAALPLGVGGDALDGLAVDITERHFLISGGYRTGRTTALRTLALGALEAIDDEQFAHLLVPRRSAVAELPGWTSISRGREACTAFIHQFATDILTHAEQDSVAGVIVVDDAGELSDAQTIAALERIVRLGRDRGIRVVAAAETSAARMLGNLWMRDLRRDGHGLLLAPDLMSDGDLLQVQLPRRSNVALGPGRGYLVDRGSASLVQIATEPAAAATP